MLSLNISIMDDLSLFIQDIIENALNVSAKHITLLVEEDTKSQLLKIEIRDNGKGMDKETLKKIEDPFYTTRTVRKVGLGLPLFKQSVLQTEGEFEVHSVINEGTTVRAVYHTNHIDMLDLGDIPSCIQAILTHPEMRHFTYIHQYDQKNFCFDTEEIKEILDITSFEDVSLLQDIKRYLADLLKETRGGKL